MSQRYPRNFRKSRFHLRETAAISERSVGKGAQDDTPDGYLQMAEKYVEAMFSGVKAGLRPLYEEVLICCLNFAPDIKACPGKTIVPLYRHHVIAQLKPSTRTRIDFGLALGGLKAEGRLFDSGGFAKKDRITHRIQIKTSADIDAEVERWFKLAYELDAEKRFVKFGLTR